MRDNSPTEADANRALRYLMKASNEDWEAFGLLSLVVFVAGSLQWAHLLLENAAA